jgi:hypothetical protein
MHLNVTDRTVLDPGTAQIMEGGRRAAQRAGLGTDIGVAFQTLQPHLLPGQHARIRRTVRLMTGSAPFHAHRGMLECERAAFVAVTSEATGFVRGDRAERAVDLASVRIMAIDAANATFL